MISSKPNPLESAEGVLYYILGTSEVQESMFSRCQFYTTGHQLVCTVPPYCLPWNPGDQVLARVYHLETGEHLSDVEQPVTLHGEWLM